LMTLCNNLNLLITTFILDPIFSLLGIFAGVLLSALIIYFCLKKIRVQNLSPKKFLYARFFIGLVNAVINFIFGFLWKGQIPTDKINDLRNKIFATMIFVGLSSFILGLATSLSINDDGRKLLKNLSFGVIIIMIIAFGIIVRSVVFAWIFLLTGFLITESSYENKQLILLVLIFLIMLIFLL
ncbi:MAG: hypothetical protein ACTSRP_20900, partial [Candidatus Helarchaeota archaeon]